MEEEHQDLLRIIRTTHGEGAREAEDRRGKSESSEEFGGVREVW